MNVATIHQLQTIYSELQAYIGWTTDDAEALRSLQSIMRPAIAPLVDDFYEELQKYVHPAAVVTGGRAQIERLKLTLARWIESLFCGVYDQGFVTTRWNVGRRHVQIGLQQCYATIALGRLRGGMLEHLNRHWRGSDAEKRRMERALNRLLDLDVAIIELAYQQHHIWQLEEQTQKQTKQTERLAAIGQMVAGLAHESRNLLQRSHACLETLQLDIGDRPEAMQQAVRIQAALDQLHGLYEEVRNYAAPINLELDDVDLHKLIAQSWKHLEPKWGPRQATFRIDGSRPKPWNIRADAQRLDQVFTNVLQNAIDASDQAPAIACGVELDADRSLWEITIGDSGPGIELPDVERIFEPFFTTKPKGTGLGLAICRRIIEAHGGVIGATTSTGGAQIRIQLPAAIHATGGDQRA